MPYDARLFLERLFARVGPDPATTPEKAPQRPLALSAATWDDLPGDWRVTFEERAATLEYDGGMTRERAEHAAFEEILKLMRDEPPADTPGKQAVIDAPTVEDTEAHD